MEEAQIKNPPKLRILLSGALPPPMGGVGSYYQTLLNSSLPQRVDLCFVQTSSQKRDLTNTGKASLANIVDALKDCLRFAKAVFESHPQIAHIGTSAGLSFVKHGLCVIVARIYGCRVLLHPHCSLIALYNERSKLWQSLFRQIIHQTHGIIVLSREWFELKSIVTDCHVYYLPNAIDLGFYRPIAEVKISQDHRAGAFRGLYIGSLGKVKGSFDILNAALELRSRADGIVFDLVGDALYPEELIELQEKIKANKLEDIVRLHKASYGLEKLNFFQEADCFIYPSYYEGMPIAVIEAMACGLPIVATRVGGLPDLVQESINGFLVEPGKPDQLASAIYQLTTNGALQISMRKASYKITHDHYDINQHVAQLLCIYNMVLEDRKSLPSTVV